MNTVNNKTATGTLGHIIRNIDKQSLAKTRNRMMVAARIADGMKARQLNQKQFAKLMGRTESEVSDWLSGDRNFTIDTLFDIGQVLGIDFLGTSIHNVYADAEIEEPVFA